MARFLSQWDSSLLEHRSLTTVFFYFEKHLTTSDKV